MLSLITPRSINRCHRERPISVNTTKQQRLPPTLKTLHTQSPDQLKQRSDNSKDSGLDQALYEWAQARTKAMTVDLQRLDENPRATDTVLRPPWRTVLVPQARIDALKTHIYYYCSPSIWMWNKIGRAHV